MCDDLGNLNTNYYYFFEYQFIKNIPNYHQARCVKWLWYITLGLKLLQNHILVLTKVTTLKLIYNWQKKNIIFFCILKLTDDIDKQIHIMFQNTDKNQTPSLKSFSLGSLHHSSKKKGLRSTKCSGEKLQNLLYFMYKKTHVVFFIFQFVQFYIFTLWMPWSMST